MSPFCRINVDVEHTYLWEGEADTLQDAQRFAEEAWYSDEIDWRLPIDTQLIEAHGREVPDGS